MRKLSGSRNGGSEEKEEKDVTLVFKDADWEELSGEEGNSFFMTFIPSWKEKPLSKSIYEIFEKINSIKDVIKPEIENHFECVLRDKFIEIRIFSKWEKVRDEDLERVSTMLGADECYFTNKTWHIRWFREE